MTSEQTPEIPYPTPVKRLPPTTHLRRAGLLRTAFAALLGCALTAWVYSSLPDEAQLVAMSRNLQFWIDSDAGEAQFKQLLYSYPVSLDDIAGELVEATLAMEDSRFFTHPGFDPRGIARALLGRLTGRANPGGGSTITQQLAKTLLLSSERSLRRKLVEVLLAIKLEHRFSKLELLELYLNRVDYGRGAQGAEAAARLYFNKRAGELNRYEAALLAGWVPAPTRTNLQANPDTAHARAAIVLRRLERLGKLDGKASAVPRKFGGGNARLRRLDHIAIFDAVRPRVHAALDGRSGRFVVVTTIEPEVQLYAEHAIKNPDAVRKLARGGASQAALIALGEQGEIRAMVGSVDRKLSQFNRALNARRQVGSTIKPLIYLAAYDNGMQREQPVSGERLEIDGWSPRNIDGRYPAALSVSDALVRSVNTAAVRVQERVGRDKVIALGRKLGIDFPLPDKPGLALGLSEATPLQVARLYSVFANGGEAWEPHLLQGLRDRRGAIVYWHADAAPRQVVSPAALRPLVADLETVISEGTGKAASLASGGHRTAGKTGTTQRNVDAWFAGFCESLTTVVWVGNDDASPTKGLGGGQLPAQMWKRFMINVLAFTRYEANASSRLEAETDS